MHWSTIWLVIRPYRHSAYIYTYKIDTYMHSLLNYKHSSGLSRRNKGDRRDGDVHSKARTTTVFLVTDVYQIRLQVWCPVYRLRYQRTGSEGAEEGHEYACIAHHFAEGGTEFIVHEHHHHRPRGSSAWRVSHE